MHAVLTEFAVLVGLLTLPGRIGLLESTGRKGLLELTVRISAGCEQFLECTGLQELPERIDLNKVKGTCMFTRINSL